MGTLKDLAAKLPGVAAFIDGIRGAIAEFIAWARKEAAETKTPGLADELNAVADKFQSILSGTELPAEALKAWAELQEAVTTFKAPVVHDPEVDLQ